MSHSILWRRLDMPGHEFGRLARRGEGWELSGTALFAHEGAPCELRYAVACDAGWRTTGARVEGRVAGREIGLEVTVATDRRWRMNGTECPAVEGCVDIDLGFSPSTNTLPIRRLSLPIGGRAEVRAAWLPFPSLVLEELRQGYRREGDTTYVYEARGGAFRRALEVNEVGLVVDYPGFWKVEPPAA